jgi:hypothetical protein
MLSEGHLLLVLHEPPLAGVPERTGRIFWRDAAGTWTSKTLGDGPHALKKHVAEFGERLDQFEQRWQSAQTAREYYSLLRAIAPLHRTARHMHVTLQQARELVPEDRDLINLRDQVGEIERGIELLHDDAKNGLNYTVAHQLEQQAERSYEMGVAAHRLNLLAAAFFPVATLSAVYSAIFGMILAHGQQEPQEWSTPALFWFLLAAGLASGLVLARIIARKPSRRTRPEVSATTKRLNGKTWKRVDRRRPAAAGDA